MKVALVSAYMLESSMPLAKHLEQENIDVHLFGIMPKYNQNLYVVDFSKKGIHCGFVSNSITVEVMGKHLTKYLSRISTRFFVYPAGAGKKTFLSDLYYAWKFSRHIIENKFDIIHLIHTANRFSLLLFFFLKKQNIIQTLHEVTAHEGVTSSYDTKILKFIIKKKIPIIFHSFTSKNRFLQYRTSITQSDFDGDCYIMIRFGLYETYKLGMSMEDNSNNQYINNSIPIILHFGRIVPYKGIDILINTVKIIQKKHPIHLIIAGGGNPYFSFEGINSYEFKNYTISNNEIIDLIKKSTVVVCPYRSASQSGIPMTVFPFHKPIIVSNLEGFTEIIEHNLTGIIVDKIDATSFADAIQILISNKNFQEQMAVNIGKKFNEGEFSWSYIAKETVSFYRKHLIQSI